MRRLTEHCLGGSGFRHLRELGLLGELMVCGEMMAVCCELHRKHINTLCGQIVEMLNVKLVVHIVTTGL